MKQFERIELKPPKKSGFNLNHEVKLTLNMGDLVPVLCEEIIPGDSFTIDTEMLLRFQPLLAPIMHRVNVYMHYFFVPNRIIWDNWEEFITGGEDGVSTPNFPRFTGQNNYFQNWSVGCLADYMGFPIDFGSQSQEATLGISQIPFRAYAQIFNDYYRDQNLVDKIDFDKGSGNITLNDSHLWTSEPLLQIRKRAWEKDYFTSALPWAQRGTPVTIPLGDTAPIINTGQVRFTGVNGSLSGSQGNTAMQADGWAFKSSSPYEPLRQIYPNQVDLSQASGATISDLRTAFSLQRWFEKNARAGSRYIEQILSHFGVKSPDARLQRAEYLGGGKLPVNISEVLQTSSTEPTSAQGNMAGHAYSAGMASGIKKHFTEHGFIMGILSVVPRTAYQNGLHKKFTKFDRFDYYWPDFAHIGEQPVYDRELCFTGNETMNANVFGYQPRYSEYRYKGDSVHGEFRDSLDFWHLGRKFSSPPNLSEDFISCEPSTRIFPVLEPQAQYLYAQIYFKISAIRPISKMGNPV